MCWHDSLDMTNKLAATHQVDNLLNLLSFHVRHERPCRPLRHKSSFGTIIVPSLENLSTTLRYSNERNHITWRSIKLKT